MRDTGGACFQLVGTCAAGPQVAVPLDCGVCRAAHPCPWRLSTTGVADSATRASSACAAQSLSADLLRARTSAAAPVVDSWPPTPIWWRCAVTDNWIGTNPPWWRGS
eukprot:249118-Prymnesium_polylepis.1